MNTICVMCEGSTEVSFVKSVLSEYLQGRITFIAKTFVTSSNHKTGSVNKGGIPSYISVKNQIINTIRTSSCDYVTTMIDYYGLRKDFPGNDNKAENDSVSIYNKIDFLENEFNKDIETSINQYNIRTKFFSYFQLHEFETLLYSDLDKLQEVEPEWCDKEIIKLKDSIKQYNNIELINDSPDTAPSKRLKNAFSNTKYSKTTHSNFIIKSIGIDNIREKCKHFNQWLDKIESITQSM